MFVGGMTGSTSGGIKQLRFRVVLGHLWRDLRQARQPRGVFLVRLGKTAVAESTVARIGAFVTLYIVIILAGTLVLTLVGTDVLTAFSGVVSDIGLVGPALGEAGPASNFLVYDEPSRLVLILMMFLGRMEIYVALLMLVTPANALRARRQRQRRTQRRQPRSVFDRAADRTPGNEATGEV
jgi:trk system potassium uptake protein TrkH